MSSLLHPARSRHLPHYQTVLLLRAKCPAASMAGPTPVAVEARKDKKKKRKEKKTEKRRRAWLGGRDPRTGAKNPEEERREKMK